MRGTYRDAPQGRRLRLFATAVCLTALVGCNSPKYALTCDLEVPVLLGPAHAIGGEPLQVQPIDEDYRVEAHRGGDRTEQGRGIISHRTGVVNAKLYAGRYEGLIIFVPVSNQWLGIEGEIALVASEKKKR